MGGNLNNVKRTGKNPVAEPANGKLRQHYRKVEKQDIPHESDGIENSGSSGGSIRPCSSESSCLNVKRNCAAELEDTERVARSDERNSSGKMTMPLWDSGVLSAVVTGCGEAPMPWHRGNDLLPSASQPERRIHALGERSLRNIAPESLSVLISIA